MTYPLSHLASVDEPCFYNRLSRCVQHTFRRGFGSAEALMLKAADLGQ
jgi:hypothetical protein